MLKTVEDKGRLETKCWLERNEGKVIVRKTLSYNRSKGRLVVRVLTSRTLMNGIE